MFSHGKEFNVKTDELFVSHSSDSCLNKPLNRSLIISGRNVNDFTAQTLPEPSTTIINCSNFFEKKSKAEIIELMKQKMPKIVNLNDQNKEEMFQKITNLWYHINQDVSSIHMILDIFDLLSKCSFKDFNHYLSEINELIDQIKTKNLNEIH